MIWVIGELIFIAVFGLVFFLVFGGSLGGGSDSDSSGDSPPPVPDPPPIPTEGPGGRDALENYVNPKDVISDEVEVSTKDEELPTPKPA